VTEEQAFLAAIAADPADATARLVFADWLTEHDDPRGEWLRARTQLALGLAEGEERARLHERERELALPVLAGWMATDAPVWALLGGGLPHPPVPEWLMDENVESWRRMAEFFRGFIRGDYSRPEFWEFLRPVQNFVVAVAGTETARLFRAGQSMTTFIVSTADQHGLSLDDASLSLFAQEKSPHLMMSYEAPNRGPRETAVCDNAAELRLHYGRLLARLWCDTRGRFPPSGA
jgi:uncharacterized protein (TIGR02996 family)